MTSLAAAYFENSSIASPGETSIESPLFLGRSVEVPIADDTKSNCQIEYFESGGMICARLGDHHFIADVGDVGLKGRGGHGHLDALSFELTLSGVAVLVDSG